MALHGLCISVALLISDITVIFDLIGAVTCAFSIFLIPGIGLLLALNAYPNVDSTNRNTNLFKVSSYIFIVLGIAYVLGSFYIGVLRFRGEVEVERDAVNTNTTSSD